ncbi:MAG: hypothetical protein JST11_26595 [Acidobacteria bacterium]|nr:hypothetical protein [Acidobacteriota bacterium]
MQIDENVFRLVVSAGVVLASLAFVVQAGVMLALYRVARKTQEDADRFLARIEPLISKAEPAIAKATGIIEQAGPVVDRIGPAVDRIGPAIDEALPLIRKAGPVLDEARASIAATNRMIDRLGDATSSADELINDIRPQVQNISREAAEIARLSREHVERLGDILQDAGEKARTRLDQIDHGVDTTIEQVGHVSVAVKQAVMKPVREVNAVAAGISAALSTLVRGQRRSNVDSATQDEEMFI